MTKISLRRLFIILAAFAVLSAATASAHGFRSNYSIPEGLELDNVVLNDGIYTGTADGFRPGLVVEITVENGTLVEVAVVDHNEVGRQFYQTPINVIPDDIVENQSTDIDAVSGATATSKAIMAAVEDAVKKAQ